MTLPIWKRHILLQNHSRLESGFFLALKGEGEFKEALSKWDEEGAEENGENENHEDGAKEVKRPGDFVDQEEVDGKNDDGGEGGELASGEVISLCYDGENHHANGYSNAGGYGIVLDVVGELVFDSGGVLF